VRAIAGPGTFDLDRNSKLSARLSKRRRISHPGFLVKISRKKLASFIGQKRVNSEGSFAGQVAANGFHCTADYRTLSREDHISLSLKRQRHQRKIARIEARLNPEQKRRIEYAARLKGTSLSDFMVLGADDAAARAIQEHEVWTLAGRDRELFVRALLNPPAPSASMKAAAQRYKRRLGTL
jgi:uncharacterized protein (DUF1778 family)